MVIPSPSSLTRPRRILQNRRPLLAARQNGRAPAVAAGAERVLREHRLPCLPCDVIDMIIGCMGDDKAALATWMRVSTVAKELAVAHLLKNAKLTNGCLSQVAFYMKAENRERIRRLTISASSSEWEALRKTVLSLPNVTVLEIKLVPTYESIKRDFFETQSNTLTTLVLNEVRFPSYWGLSGVVCQFPNLRTLELWDCHWPELLEVDCDTVQPMHIDDEKKTFPDPWQMDLKTLRIQSRYPNVVNAYAQSIIGDRQALSIETLAISCPFTVDEEPYLDLINLSSSSLRALHLAMSLESIPRCMTSEEHPCLPFVTIDKLLEAGGYRSLTAVRITVAPGEFSHPQDTVQGHMRSLLKRGVLLDVQVKQPDRLEAFPFYTLDTILGVPMPLGPGNRVRTTGMDGRGLWGLGF